MTRIIRILAPNPGPFTLEGTNTWIAGAEPTLVIDPGPDDRSHIEGVAQEAGSVAAILLTHHHPDHVAGVGRLAALTGAPVRAFRPLEGGETLLNGASVRGGGIVLRAVHTPGHTADHLAFHDPETGALFTGDAVLGRGTSVIDPPDGDMAAYLTSLERMRGLGPSVLYPGHGPAAWAGRAKLDEYLQHRRERERQVLECLKNGPRSPDDLVPQIYGDYPVDMRPFAARSLLAHLLKLEGEGIVGRVNPADDRFGLLDQSGQGESRARGVHRGPRGPHQQRDRAH